MSKKTVLIVAQSRQRKMAKTTVSNDINVRYASVIFAARKDQIDYAASSGMNLSGNARL